MPSTHQSQKPSVFAFFKLLSTMAVASFLSAILPGCGSNKVSADTSDTPGDPAADAAAHPELFNSAESGNAETQTRIGLMYYGANGVPQDKRQAAEWFRKAAEQGYAPAQYYLGDWYRIEQTGAQGNAQAIVWFRKAAEQGYAPAQYGLANLYHLGRGTAQDEVLAVTWYRKAAEQGYALAQRDLGYTYAKGLGIEMDLVRAHMWLSLSDPAGAGKKWTLLRETELRMSPEQIKQAGDLAKVWKMACATRPKAPLSLDSLNAYVSIRKKLLLTPQFRKELSTMDAKQINHVREAAEKGDADGQFALAVIYQEGCRIVRQDEQQAVFWFRKSAEGGSQDAQVMLGTFYALGMGIDKDLVQAHKWLSLSRFSFPVAEKFIHRLESDMTPEQILQARDLENNWKPR